MTIEEVRAILATHWDELASMGVRSLRVFGSVARGEAGPDSDVDFLVEMDPELDLFDFIDIKLFLQDTLGTDVDLVELHVLKPRVRESAEREAVHAG